MSGKYVSEFPIPAARLPPKLRRLLEPVDNDPAARVEVSSRFQGGEHGSIRETVHMVMVLVPDAALDTLSVLRDASVGVVSFSTPIVGKRGDKAKFNPSVSGADYIVASWGSTSFFSYHLAEKVWMALGLSPRCVGGDEQRVIYDDLSLPAFGVAEGEISSDYHFSLKRNVSWTMINSFLRRYIWMRGAYGVRIFFYETVLPDCPELRALMAGEAQVCKKPEGGWYDLTIREWKGGLLTQVSAAVPAVAPELCSEPSAEGLIWPGVADPMTSSRANALFSEVMPVYLDDKFLERYEQRDLFDTTPVNIFGSWYCAPSYRGQWAFTECVRVGRNLVRVPMRELYKPKPDREILHAHDYALDPSRVAEMDLDEEHIVSKTARFLDQLLSLGDHLAGLGNAIGAPENASAIVKFSREELRANGWRNYPELSCLAQVAPTAMGEKDFLARCKNINELWQHIPTGILRSLVGHAGHDHKNIKNLQRIRLLQALLNTVERLNAESERVEAFKGGMEPSDLTQRSIPLAPLFITNDLRIADAHDTGDVLSSLEKLGFDSADLSHGYGRALDHVFDKVISAFSHLNMELEELLSR